MNTPQCLFHFKEWAIMKVQTIMSILCSFILHRWPLTHWVRVTHICVGKLTIIGSDNGLSPGRRQAIIWTSAGILLNETLGTNFSEILIGIQIFSFEKMRLKMSSAKWRPFCLGLNVLTEYTRCEFFCMLLVVSVSFVPVPVSISEKTLKISNPRDW